MLKVKAMVARYYWDPYVLHKQTCLKNETHSKLCQTVTDLNCFRVCPCKKKSFKSRRRVLEKDFFLRPGWTVLYFCSRTDFQTFTSFVIIC